MSPSDHVDQLVDDYLHDLLTTDKARQLEQHCQACLRCRSALEQARRRLRVLQDLPPSEPSGRLVRSTLDRVEEHEARRRIFRRRVVAGTLFALAASMLLLLGAQLYYNNLTASPVDLVVLGQNKLFADSTASLRILLSDHRQGAALARVPVRVELLGPGGQKEELANFQTDEHGSGAPRVQVPGWASGDCTLRVTASTPGGQEVLERPVKLVRSWKVMLSSDKPVYQPGQKIQVRALALRRPDLIPAQGAQAVFLVSDPRGNVIFKHTRPTSPYGLTWCECALDSEVLEGPYTITCSVDGTESKLTVEVMKYVLPKFKLELRPDRPYYAPGGHARLTIQADYFFGKPVADADVQVELRTSDPAPRVVQKVPARTDERGEVVVSLPLPTTLVGREQDSGDARITFAVTVTDSAGQKVSTTSDRLVTTRPIRIDCVPESATLVPGVPNTLFTLVQRADGTPVMGAKVVIQGIGINAESRTDERGAASCEINPPGGDLHLVVRVLDAGGTELARKGVPLGASTLPLDFLVRPDRAAYRGGQSMTLTVLGAGVEPVLVDFLKDGQTLLSTTVEMKDGTGEETIDLPADLFGTIQLVAYRFAGHGLPVRKSRVIYVQPPEGLTVQASFDAKEYRPGREAKIELALTDAKGKPVPGALSLAAVDEAVFAVLASKPGMEKVFYNLEQELLKPVYVIYPAWMPEPERGGAAFDRALLSRTAAGEGGFDAAGGVIKGVAPGGRVSSVQEVTPSRFHSLAASSFPAKKQQTEAARQRGLERVRMGWAALICLVGLLAYGSLWFFLPVGDVLKIHGVIFLGGLGLGILGVLILGGLLGTGSKSGFSHVASRMAPGGVHFEGDMAPAGGAALPMAVAPGLPSAAPGTGDAGGTPAPRIRQHFPETLLWKPQLITDDAGKASLTIELADSITTWRLSASAVSADGRLGAVQMPLKVFQPFFVDLDLPVYLTRNDKVGVSVVVHNHLDTPQVVTLTLKKEKWFDLEGPAELKVELKPHEVRGLSYPIQVHDVGSHPFLVTALGSGVSDAIQRTIEVVPDGRKVELAHSGTLDRPFETTVSVPGEAIEGSAKLLVKVYPSTFSQVVEGLDNIFRMPYGCFEQTSSTTYPNVLALSYLRSTGKSVPEVEAKARQYIHLGYQRLVSFEVQGGGFDWFGRPPANRRLTAYGLMEFEDMAKVHDVDPALIRRTRDWLLAQRKADGSWEEATGLHSESDPARGQRGKLARHATTAYIAWAVFNGQSQDPRAQATLAYLKSTAPDQIDDPYLLALTCSALLALDPSGAEARSYLDRLESLKRSSDDGKLCWWELPAGARTAFFGAGQSGNIEATAQAALALLAAGQHGGTASKALAWLVSKKDPQGTWYSTQATVLSLKALLAGAGKARKGEGARRIIVEVGGHREELNIPADQAEVMKLVDLTRHLKEGKQTLKLSESTSTGAGFQVALRYHVPDGKPEARKDSLAVSLEYDRTELEVGEEVKAKVVVENRTASVAPMVMLDLPVPPGFVPQTESLAKLVQEGAIGKFQVRPRTVLVYLRGLAPGKPLELRYSLRATLPVSASAPGARMYEYYDPQKEAASQGARFQVKPRP